MSLRLAASMGAAQTAVGIVLSFISIKITSVYLGPSGLGTLGQLTYFMAMAQAILIAGVGTGVVRRISQLSDNRPGRESVISTVLRALIVLAVPTSLVMAFGSTWLARELLHDEALSFALLIFSSVLAFGLTATVIMSCANGMKDFRTLALINIGSGCASFVMVAVLCPLFGVRGGLIATATLPLVTCSIAWGLARRHDWWPKQVLSHGFSGQEARGLATYVPLAVVSAVGLPLSQLLIRDTVVISSGMSSVGLLQGVMRISEMYLGVASGVFAMYFFPRFSEIGGSKELLGEIRLGLIVIVPAVAIASLTIYLLRDWIIRLVFTVDFLPMRDLFAWQMVGNTLKMVGWLFGYVLLAKVNAFAMTVLEVAAIGLLWLSSTYFVSRNGVVGATQGFAATYAVYSVIVAVGVAIVLKRMRSQTNPETT